MRSRAKELQAISRLSAPHETGSRYRPAYNRPRYGISVELYVRDHSPDRERERMVWRRVTRWYKTHLARTDALQQLRWHLGLYGMQLAQGTLRRIKLVHR